ncbi:MAG: ABC transporter permease subunit, partial [Thermostichus sp. BF3_bins_97]
MPTSEHEDNKEMIGDMIKALLEELGKDYVRTARGMGLPERKVLWEHALRNALIPTVTMIGL